LERRWHTMRLAILCDFAAVLEFTREATWTNFDLGDAGCVGRGRARQDCARARRVAERNVVRDCSSVLLPGRLPALFGIRGGPAARVGRYSRHPFGAPRRRPRLLSDEQVGFVWTPFCRNCWAGTACRSYAGSPIWVFAGDLVADCRRGVRRV